MMTSHPVKTMRCYGKLSDHKHTACDTVDSTNVVSEENLNRPDWPKRKKHK